MADYKKAADLLINIFGEPVKRGIRAFHGSPHKFDKFSTGAIGTGEGNQAYGHGLYFAEHEPTALSYKNMPRVTDMNWPVPGTDYDVPAWVARSAQTPRGLDEVRENFLGRVREAQAAGAAGDWNQAGNVPGLQRIVDALDYVKAGRGTFEKPGHMYEVNINARPAQFLDLDRPLAQQSEEVQSIVRPKIANDMARVQQTRDEILARGRYSASGRPLADKQLERLREPLTPVDALTGTDVYKRYGLPAKDQFEGYLQSTARLRDAGIPGLRYLDQGSRNPGFSSLTPTQLDARISSLRSDIASGGGNQQAMADKLAALERERDSYPKLTHNYVVFDDSLIDVLKRYGMGAGILAPGAAATLSQGDQGVQ